MYSWLLNKLRLWFRCRTAEINDTNFSAVANTCDEDVSLSSGTEDRFTINGTFTLDKSPKVILQNMLTTMVGI